MRLIKFSFTKWVLIAPIFFCCQEDTFYNVNPYSSFELVSESVKCDENNTIYIDENLLKNKIQYSELFIKTPYFQLLEISDKEILLFSSSEQKLFLLNPDSRDNNLRKIADFGMGPDEILNGIKLISYKGENFLVQRNRVSKVSKESERVFLEVITNFKDYINYYLPLKDEILINNYSADSYPSFRSVDTYFEDTGNYMGGSIKNLGINYQPILDFNIVAHSNDSEFYIQAFNYFPYVGVFNKSLILKKVITIQDFKPITLAENENKIIEWDIKNTETFTQLIDVVNNNGDLILIYSNNVLNPDNDDLDILESHYIYFKIDKNLKLTCLGKSDKYVISIGENIFYVDEGILHQFSK